MRCFCLWKIENEEIVVMMKKRTVMRLEKEEGLDDTTNGITCWQEIGEGKPISCKYQQEYQRGDHINERLAEKIPIPNFDWVNENIHPRALN